MGLPPSVLRPLAARTRAAACGLFVCLTVAATSLAGAGDRPEPGLQGQSLPEDRPGEVLERPYAQGVEVVGHHPVWGRDSNVQMAWVDHCAYLSSSPPNFLYWGIASPPETYGVAVIDASDPRRPRGVKILRDPGARYAAEALAAVETPARSVLVAGTYEKGADPQRDAGWMSIYDAADCARPRLAATFRWPVPIHALALTPDGRLVYATEIHPFRATGALHVLDISDLRHPRYLGRYLVTDAAGESYEFAVHDLSFSADGRRLYAGVLGSQRGDLNPGVEPGPSTAYLGPDGGGVYILDNSELLAGAPNARLRLVGVAPRAGWHSPVPATIGGRPHLVSGGELGACPGAWPRILDISDETAPVLVGEFRLAMNRPENCPPPGEAARSSRGIAPDPGTATLHYNSVDDPLDTRLGLFNFMWAGLRITDLRDPTKPREVAYFKPGDACGGEVRYLRRTGHIWLSCAKSGFWVLRLAPPVRRALGLDGPRPRP